uniref:ERCC4 domain-containing protein n=1 Tax=viral metagenome TaxID=1070528 RepID=A0A6C0H7R8_9ZZZZ
MVKVIIDCREHDLIDLMKNIEFSVKQLDIGDIIITDNQDKELIIIERKTVNDLDASIKDGRYEEQSYRLSGYENVHNHNIIYLIEGNNDEKKIIYSAMFSIMYYKGFSLIQTKSISETVNVLTNMVEKMGKEETKIGYYLGGENTKEYSSLIKKEKSENITKENIDEIMLSQIPGVSINVANTIIKKYGSLSNMIKKGENEIKLEEITFVNKKGKSQKISKTACKNIREYLLIK